MANEKSSKMSRLAANRSRGSLGDYGQTARDARGRCYRLAGSHKLLWNTEYSVEVMMSGGFQRQPHTDIRQGVPSGGFETGNLAIGHVIAPTKQSELAFPI